MLHAFRLADRHLSRTSGPEPTTSSKASARTSHFRSGLAVDAQRKRLYSLDVDRGTISQFDLDTLKELKSAAAGTRPYDVVLARNGLHLFVSDWAGRRVRILDPDDLHTVAQVSVGEHPTQIAVHPGDDRIFVACASSNCVSVIDTRRGIVTETIITALFPQAPEGSTPDALAVSPDGKTLAVGDQAMYGVGGVSLRNGETGKERATFQVFTDGEFIQLEFVNALAFSPDGKILASAGPKSIRLSDAGTGHELATIPTGEGSPVRDLVFSPDSKTLTSSGYQVVQFWDVPATLKKAASKLERIDASSAKAVGNGGVATLIEVEANRPSHSPS